MIYRILVIQSKLSQIKHNKLFLYNKEYKDSSIILIDVKLFLRLFYTYSTEFEMVKKYRDTVLVGIYIFNIVDV